jgi:GNAT superfamily N-acetyltransferase
MPSPAPDAALDVRVEPCGPRDRAEQVQLFNACFKKKIDERALVWRYDENPHGRAVSFLSRPAGSEGVSGYACTPRTALSFGDEATRATIGETGDVMTHPDWRKKGLFSALDRACMAESKRLGWPLVFGLPNRRSAHIFLELGWEKVGTLRPWTFVLRASAAARRERAKEGRVASWLAPLHALAGRAARRALARAASTATPRVTIELASFPREVEELSREIEKKFALMVRRDAEYLNWRFARSPSRLHRAIGLYRASGELDGYAVVQLPRAGEHVGYVVDVLARDETSVAAAIAAALSRLESAGAALVQATAIDGSWWSTELERAGFRPPKPENHLTVILHVHDREHPLARAARDASKWYLTDGDRDDETMG